VFRAADDPRLHVVGQKKPPPADDAWMQHDRDLSRTLVELNRRRRAGQLTDDEYRIKLGALLGMNPDILPGEPDLAVDGLWIGSSGNLILKFCKTRGFICDVHVVDAWKGEDKETHERFAHSVNFTLPGTIFNVGDGGRVDDIFVWDEPDDLWKGVSITIRGTIGARAGRFYVEIHSDTDVAVYGGSIEIMTVRLVDPNGCNY